jgi:DNA-binding transcriptional LysR family regulator
MMVSDDIKGGVLVRLTPEWVPKGGIIHAVFPSRRGQLPSVRKLIDYLAMRFEQVDET